MTQNDGSFLYMPNMKSDQQKLPWFIRTTRFNWLNHPYLESSSLEVLAAALATPAFPCVRRRGRSGAADGSLGTETQEMVEWETRLEYKINSNNDNKNNNSNDVLIMYSMLMYILVF